MPIARLILRIAGQQRARPALAAVVGLEEAQPRVAGFVVGEPGKIDGAVVVRTGEQVQRVARRCGDRRLVLPLQNTDRRQATCCPRPC